MAARVLLMQENNYYYVLTYPNKKKITSSLETYFPYHKENQLIQLGRAKEFGKIRAKRLHARLEIYLN